MKNKDDATAFFGQVTASTTHEIQNVLAIIKENAGLMEDFIMMNPDSSSGSNSPGPNSSGLMENITKCIGKIKEQAYRGVDLTSGLNWFAHSTDRFQESVNIHKITGRLIFLTKRLFAQKGIEVVLTDCKQSPSIETDPVVFQKVLWDCLECLIETLNMKTNIIVNIINSEAGKGIEFCFADSTLENGDFTKKLSGSAKWKDLEKTCKEINLTPQPITRDLPGIRLLLDPNL